jgi:hypothetical protein
MVAHYSKVVLLIINAFHSLSGIALKSPAYSTLKSLALNNSSNPEKSEHPDIKLGGINSKKSISLVAHKVFKFLISVSNHFISDFVDMYVTPLILKF